ncbi:ABC transporter permease [Leifsonia sp. Root112D2]|uniref:ABC transporter permease n=1 Tax=Leifsonia sp. Root112D2 TaxID=1736426 RepID=UPI0006F82BAB|nr:ABC transporter permease [Leifsonia sp. Root112D2]KQV06394.1 ABC transporter permease [Leifsonia sp. Root112D2]
MTQFSFARLIQFLSDRSEEIVDLALQHIGVVAISLIIAMIVAMGIGMLTWNRPIPRSLAVTAAGIALTIPSLALLAVLIRPFGLGWTPTVIALSFYSLLPIVRNTVVGLREVPSAVMESAKGMGMGGARILFTIQLPIAWPIILTGVRVSAQMAIGIAAIAAYVAGPGLGTYIFQGLSSLGSVNALNYALVGTVCVVILALLVDGLFVLITRFTTSRGLRA